MFFARTLVAFTFAATAAMANPVMKRDVGGNTTCFFIMTPTPDLGAIALQTSSNYAVGHRVGEEYPNTLLTIDNKPLVRHNDGTYDVMTIIGVEGQDPVDVGAFVKTWEDTTLDGLEAQWFVDAADCVV